MIMAGSERKAVIVGISGASSSGKTTISRLLRDIFPNTFVLHEDDFYKPEAEIPKVDGLTDWDCAESLNIHDLVTSLDYIQKHGSFPPDFTSKEDRNSVGPIPIPADLITALKTRVLEWTQPGHKGHGILTSSSSSSPSPSQSQSSHALKLLLLDGFLLYNPSSPTLAPLLSPSQSTDPHQAPLIPIKLFLRTTHHLAKSRREARDGYATLEGWWKDPPGYVDKIVWPNYVRNHGWMFEDGEVGGRFKNEVLEQWGIRAFPVEKLEEEGGQGRNLGETLQWAVETVMRELERVAVEIKGGEHVHRGTGTGR